MRAIRRMGLGSDRVALVAEAAARLGLQIAEPRVISDGGNLLVHLAPAPVVARVATLFGDDDAAYWHGVLDREVRVARHLHGRGVPAVTPTSSVDAGPHPVSGTWMTLWDYTIEQDCPDLRPADAGALLGAMGLGLQEYAHPLPVLGAWTNAADAIEKMASAQDHRVRTAIDAWQMCDERFRSIPVNDLKPAHGDAHVGNLMCTMAGWTWLDFEDVSLMPRYWDLACMVARTPLLDEEREFSEELVRDVLGPRPSREEEEAFTLSLAARALVSTLVNLALAQAGHADPQLAERRLVRLPEVLEPAGLLPSKMS